MTRRSASSWWRAALISSWVIFVAACAQSDPPSNSASTRESTSVPAPDEPRASGQTAPEASETTEPEEVRDPWLRPFRSDSIWNTPIGSGAVLQPAGLPVSSRNPLTYVYLAASDPQAPVVPVLESGGWRTRCSGTEPTGHQVRIPPDFEIEPPSRQSNGSWRTPNNGAVFLLDDGRTLLNLDATARCAEGGPVYGVTTGETLTDIYGDGIGGAHGASHLSHLGGAIRPGELTSDEPIRHVLDLAVWSKYLFSDGKRTVESTYRWPASSSDAYALDRSRTDNYVGDDPELRMGSLVAIPPEVSADGIGVHTAEGRKIFEALRDFGAYITDDSARDGALLHVDAAAKDEFHWSDAHRAEMGRMVAALAVVTNNGPDAIGGGGEPRVPLLPELDEP